MSGIALLHHSFGPYHVARASRLAELLGEPLHLLELAPSEQLRAWDRPDARAVKSAVDGALEKASASDVSNGVRRLLDDARPDVLVIAGYAHPGMRAAAAWSRANSARAVLLSDSHQLDKTRFRVKETAKSLYVRAHFDAAFTSGASGALYVQSLGVPPERIWRGYDVVDNARFAELAAKARASDSETRARLRLPERFFLYVGRFAEEKNLTALLAAYAKHVEKAGAAASALVLAGSGPLEAALRKDVLERRLDQNVFFPGFFQQQELGLTYGLARALLLPSTVEPWGLVVNEAMAASLPVVVSTRCGCALDLVFPGVNGFLVRPDDAEGLAGALGALDADAELRARMGAESARIIAPWSLDRWALALRDCVRAVRK